MSTVTHPGAPRDPKDPEDAFRYGWRFQKAVGPNGVEKLTKIPLTLEDVHHPQEEDFIMQRGGHAEDCIYLHDVLRTHLGEAALVTFDLRIAWDTPEVEPLGPDITVIFGGVFDRDRGTFDCAVEGMRPSVVFEVTSPDTRHIDLGEKIDEYFLAGVHWYVIIDAVGFRDGKWDLRVLGYRHAAAGFTRVVLDERNRLWVEPLRLFVTAQTGRIVCYEESGKELLNHPELSKALALEQLARLKAEQAREVERQQCELAQKAQGLAEQERVKAEQAREAERQQRELAQKAQELAEQERVKAEQAREVERQQRELAQKAQGLAEQEKVKAEQEKVKAEQEKVKAEQQRDAERQQRQTAEQTNLTLEERLRQMEAELRRLRGDL